MRAITLFLTASALGLASCADTEPVPENTDLAPVAIDNAADNGALANGTAAPAPAMTFAGGDGTALGSLMAEDGASGLVLRLAGTGMPPGIHGLHIHMAGKCEGPAFESAGAHWNPDDKQHGTENPQGPHRGDLPNVTVGADGSLTETVTVAGMTLAELRDADGSALVLHASPDDNKTDPSGNSGERIACAVIAPAG